MNKHRKPLALYLIFASLLSLAAVVLRTVACFTKLDYQFGYFTDKVLINTSGAIVAVLCILALSYLFIGPKESLRASFATPITYIPSGVVGVCLLFVSAHMFIYAGDAYSESSAYIFPKMSCLLAAALAIPTAIHFLLNAFYSERKCELRAWFSLSTVIFFTFLVAFLYFEASTPLNAPNKLVDQCALLLASIFFLYESRISLGRSLWRGYITFGIISASLLYYSSIPTLVVFFTKKELLSFSLELALLMLVCAVFISLRLSAIFSQRSESDDGGVSVLTASAMRRRIEVEEKESIYRSIYATRQMAISDLFDFDDASDPLAYAESQPASKDNDSGEDGHDKLDDMQITIDDAVITIQDEEKDNKI